MTGDKRADVKPAQARPVRVLIVEDNPGDVRLIKEAFAETERSYETAVANDGVQALDYLLGRGQFSAAPHPDLVLLDLNLPRKTGHEVLTEIKQDSTLMTIPVVVFSSSSAPGDIGAAYGAHANCYVTKPTDLDELFRTIAWVDKFWLDTAKLPNAG